MVYEIFGGSVDRNPTGGPAGEKHMAMVGIGFHSPSGDLLKRNWYLELGRESLRDKYNG